MTIILLITGAVIILYLIYPAYLKFYPQFDHPDFSRGSTEQAVTLILLTYNGIADIQEKLRLLSEELEHFHEYEFIVIDDYSTDGTCELLESLKSYYDFKLVLKNGHRGIPNSMNLGVEMASHACIIFCDQRQIFTGNFIRELIYPLQNAEIGAVSGCISCFDNVNHWSVMRIHENFIKKCENEIGYVIGVYGPLYAVKKSCYTRIGDNIILDDLYLSLKILGKKRIVLVENCRIVDNEFNGHYNFTRSHRYLKGLLQILVMKNMIGPLPMKIKIMLLWHKYLRLLIPPLLILSFVTIAIASTLNLRAALIFWGTSIIFFISVVGRKMNFFSNLYALFRINFYYFFSIVFIVTQRIFKKTIFSVKEKKI